MDTSQVKIDEYYNLLSDEPSVPISRKCFIDKDFCLNMQLYNRTKDGVQHTYVKGWITKADGSTTFNASSLNLVVNDGRRERANQQANNYMVEIYLSTGLSDGEEPYTAHATLTSQNPDGQHSKSVAPE